MRIMGKQLVVACARAVKPFRNPGADTVRQIPGLCVRNPEVAAAYPAFCSCLKDKTLIPEACIIRPRSVIGIPGTLYMVSIPFSLRASITRLKPSVSSVASNTSSFIDSSFTSAINFTLILFVVHSLFYLI